MTRLSISERLFSEALTVRLKVEISPLAEIIDALRFGAQGVIIA